MLAERYTIWLESKHSDHAAELRKLSAAGDHDGFKSKVNDLHKLSTDEIALAASHFTGSGINAFRTKASAIKAINDKHRQTTYLNSKIRVNSNVMPW